MNEQASHNKSYTLTDIERYLQGRLSPAEMHAMEKAALQDPLLADAIEGYRESGTHKARVHLQDIQQQLLQQKNRAPVVKGHFAAKRWWQAAAVIITLAGVGGTGWYFLHSSAGRQEMAVNSKSTAIVPAKSDTAATQPATPPPVVVAEPSPVNEKRPSAQNHHAVPGPPIADRDTAAPLPKTEPAPQALADTRSEKMRQPMMLRERAAGNIDTFRNTNLSESLIPDPAQQRMTAHAAQRPTAPVDSLNLSPDGGWEHFNEYLTGKLGPDTHGEVVADLVLDDMGKITDIIIIRAFDRSLEAFGRTMNRKIKQVLLNGPAWLAGNTKKPGTFRLNLAF